MPELNPIQMAVLERLFANGFLPSAYPLYPNSIGIHREGYAALLGLVEGGGLRLASEPCYLIEGNFSARVKRDGGDWFVWKSKKVAATAERLAELKRFSDDLSGLLLPSA